mgnify:FL=1|jgi:hypothetical protein
MIIQKKGYTTGDTVALRLLTGEEVVGKVVANDDISITITKPVSVRTVMSPDGAVHIAFAPFMVSVAENSDFRIALDKLLVSPLLARDEVRNRYIEATTGIITGQTVQVPQG